MPHTFSEMMSAAGSRILVGSVWNPAGLLLAKSLPQRRADVFTEGGLGASSTWHGFCIDRGGIAQTPGISAVGDQRLVAGAHELRHFSRGIAWVPLEFRTQEGDPVAECSRTRLRTIEANLAAAGLTARVGHELEFVLTHSDGSPLDDSAWAPYSLGGLHCREAFVSRLYELADEVLLPIDQVHAEYAPNQFEFSLAPDSPTAAADSLALARYVVAQAAQEQGLAASFSPLPFLGSAGNGAHQHFSLARGEEALFGGGRAVHGLTDDGAHAIAGVVSALPAMQAGLCGSIVSGLRMAPGMWSGAYASWGLENREASVRLVASTPANPRGANVEVKINDPSSNPYIASSLILRAALDGIEKTLPLQPEAQRNPAEYSESERSDLGIAELTSDLGAALDAFASSDVVTAALGEPLAQAVSAVRCHELGTYGDRAPEELAAMFRLSWGA